METTTLFITIRTGNNIYFTHSQTGTLRRIKIVAAVKTARFFFFKRPAEPRKMFTLWYTVLTYKEYRDSVWEKLSTKKPPPPKETAIVCPLPPKKNEPPSRIPVVEPPKPSRTPSPQVPPSPPSPQPQVRPQAPPQKPPSPQIPPSPPVPAPVVPNNPPQKLDPPPKPPRSPSPHPIKAEILDDDIEYEEEESEEESEPEEEEDSVLATPQRKPVAKSVNEFIDREKTT